MMDLQILHQELLYRFRRRHPKQVELIDLEKNLGKGNAVREGIQTALKNSDCNTFAYLDAQTYLLRLTNALIWQN